MTTVAVDLDLMTMAADSLCTCGGASFETDKIFIGPDGTLLGICGTLEDCVLFKDWYFEGADIKEKPEFSEPQTFSAITLNKTGCHEWGTPCVAINMKSRRYAIGSGAQAARAAMECGKTITEAIEVACKVDLFSGGEVVTIKYVSKRKPPSGLLIL